MWDTPDALDGRIIQIEQGKTGAAALLIETAEKSHWVTHIPPDRLPVHAAIGTYVRIIHAHLMNDPQAPNRVWRAGRLAAIRICLPHGC